MYIIDSPGQGHCECLPGYVKISGKCEQYNACDSKHREAHKDPSKETCEDKEADCRVVAWPVETQFECICKKGFFNEFGKFLNNFKL